MYFSYSVLGGEFDHQVIGQSYSLSRVEGRSSEDGIVGRRVIDNKEYNILSDLLRIITNCYRQRDCVKGVYFCPSERNKWGIGWVQPFSVNLICWSVG